MAKIFEYVSTISKKVGIFPQDNMEEFNSVYVKHVVNLAFCRYSDTIFIVDYLVINPQLTNLQHFEYLYNTVPKINNRYSAWSKEEKSVEIEVIQDVYKYSYEKAKSVIDLFSQKDLDILKTKILKGGREIND